MLLGAAPLGRYALGQFPESVATSTFYGDTEVICVHWEDRSMSATDENRTMLVRPEDRDMVVLSEPRAVVLEPRKRAC